MDGGLSCGVKLRWDSATGSFGMGGGERSIGDQAGCDGCCWCWCCCCCSCLFQSELPVTQWVYSAGGSGEGGTGTVHGEKNGRGGREGDSEPHIGVPGAGLQHGGMPTPPLFMVVAMGACVTGMLVMGAAFMLDISTMPVMAVGVWSTCVDGRPMRHSATRRSAFLCALRSIQR